MLVENEALVAQREAEVKMLKIAIETLRPIVYKTVGLRGSEAPGRRQQEGLLPTVQVRVARGGRPRDKSIMLTNGTRSVVHTADFGRVRQCGVGPGVIERDSHGWVAKCCVARRRSRRGT